MADWVVVGLEEYPRLEAGTLEPPDEGSRAEPARAEGTEAPVRGGIYWCSKAFSVFWLVLSGVQGAWVVFQGV